MSEKININNIPRIADFQQFINDSKNNKHTTTLCSFGIIRDYIAEKLKALSSYKVYKYEVILTSNYVRHIINQHGQESEKLRDQVPVEDKDFEKISDIIFNAEKIAKGKDVDIIIDGKKVYLGACSAIKLSK